MEPSLRPVLYDLSLLFYLWLFFVVWVLALALRWDLTMVPMLALNSRFFQPQLTSVLGISRKHHSLSDRMLASNVLSVLRASPVPLGKPRVSPPGALGSVLDHRSHGH